MIPPFFILEKHIESKIRDYLKPFKFFLGAIGRFPYTVENNTKKKNILQVISYESDTIFLHLSKPKLDSLLS
jgi:hypothetical protein